MRRNVHTVAIVAAAATLISHTAPVVAASELERALERELVGAWGVLAVEVYSDCGGSYSNNQAHGTNVTSKADRGFEPGELAKVDKIKLKKARVDIFLSLGVPVLESRIEGPFELFDERSCRVQLMVNVPREEVKAQQTNAVLDRLRRVVELHSTLDAARASDSWNGREREPLPEGYEQTLFAYETWHAEQLNAAVAERGERAVADAVRTASAIERDADYLDGFAAGVEEARDWRASDCDDLVDLSVDAHERRAPSDRRGKDPADRAWREGYRDGQRLMLELLVADALRGCFVPPPAP
jgi:hypothetical protein